MKMFCIYVLLWTTAITVLGNIVGVISSVSIHVPPDIVTIGQVFKINCRIDKAAEKGFFKWHQNDNALFYDGRPTDYAGNGKFTETRSNLSSTLMIHNFSEIDVRSSIGCGFGTTGFVWKNLTVYMQWFKYIPTIDEMNVTAIFESSSVLFQLKVQKVFPGIDCKLNSESFEVKSKRQNGLFFSIVLTAKHVTCDSSMLFKCSVGTTEMAKDTLPRIICPDIPLVQTGVIIAMSIVFLLSAVALAFKFWSCHECNDKSKTMTNNEDTEKTESESNLDKTEVHHEEAAELNPKADQLNEPCKVDKSETMTNNEDTEKTESESNLDKIEVHREEAAELNPKADQLNEPCKVASLTRIQILSSLCAFTGSSFLYGYNMAVVNNAGKVMLEAMQPKPNDDIKLNIKAIWAFAVSSYALGGVIGLLMSKLLLSRFRRKWLLNFNLLIVIVSAVIGCLTYIDHVDGKITFFIVHRILMGFSCASNLIIAAVYVMEITDLKQSTHTGLVGTYDRWFQLSISMGILTASVLGLEYIFGSQKIWIALILFNVGPAILSLVCLQFCPESPVFLAQRESNENEAIKSLQRLMGTSKKDIKDTLQNIKKERKKSFGFLDIWHHKDYRPALLLFCFLHACQQFSGINAIIAYSSFIYKDAIVQDTLIQWVVLSLMFLNFTMTLYSRWTIYRCGIRHILQVTMTIISFSCVLLFVLSYLCNDQHDVCPVFAVLSIYAYIFCFSMGLGPIPYITVKDLFPEHVQPVALNIALGVNWIANFLVLLLFPILQSFGSYIYIILTFFLILMILAVYNILPETKKHHGEVAAGREFLSSEKIYETKYFIRCQKFSELCFCRKCCN